MGTWSEPVEGREEVAHWRNAGNIWELAKARSIVLRLWEPEKEKWV